MDVMYQHTSRAGLHVPMVAGVLPSWDKEM